MERAPSSDADGAADEGEQDGLSEELDADVAFGGAERAPQSDLGSSFEDGDDHDVGHPDRPDQERHRAETQEEVVEGALGVGLGDKGGRRLGHVDLAGVLRVGGGGQQVVDRVDLAGLGAHVDGRGMAVEAEVVLGGGEADEDRGVDVGGEHGRVQDAGHVEPHVVEPDPLAGVDPVDPEALGGRRAEYSRRALGRSPR